MALYDMACDNCGYRAEVKANINKGPPKKCPTCGKKLRQVFTTPPAFHTHYSPMHPRAKRGRGY